MKNYAKIFLCILLLNCNANASDSKMMPLDEIMMRENTPSMLAYGFERCSGLFGAVYGLFASSSREGAKEIGAQFLSKSVDSTIAAVQVGERHGLNISPEQANQNAINFMKNYENELKNNWERTGNNFSKAFMAEQELCINLLENKEEKIASVTSSSSAKKIFGSSAWLVADKIIKSDFKDESPQGCKIDVVLNTKQGPRVSFSKSVLFIPGEGLAIIFNALLKKTNGEILNLSNFSKNTSTDLREWEYTKELEAFVIAGDSATRFLIEYSQNYDDFWGWALEKKSFDSFDPNNDFIFLEFKDRGSSIHVPFFLGEEQLDYQGCVSRSLQELLSTMG